MEVTGYQLKEAIKLASLELSMVASQFEETLFKFADETKRTPAEVADEVAEVEEKLAKLQTAQSQYNLAVTVNAYEDTMTLEEAIKLVGGAGRIAKMWRTAAKGGQRSRWESIQAGRRSKDEEIAQPTISRAEALENAKDAERIASRLRGAIAVGNSVKVSIDLVDENLLG